MIPSMGYGELEGARYRGRFPLERRVARRVLAGALPALALLALGAPPAQSRQASRPKARAAARRGGTLTVLDETDFERLDPGISFYSLDYEIVYATQRPLYSDKPGSVRPSPDLASGAPLIAPDGRTVTVNLKRGIHFSPPVNREVTSADVAYAIERGTNPHVANPYIHAYFDSVIGISTDTGGPIKGITTPNPHQIVFHLDAPRGQTIAEALQLPLTAPVPRQYARRLDRQPESSYGSHEVATGPYMIGNDRSGKTVGYRPGVSLTLVRNPNWSRSTDFRPAYLNRVVVKIGGGQSEIARRVLNGGAIVENEPASRSAIALAVAHHPGQLEVSPGAGDHFIGVNNRVGPFSNVNLRKAFWAALNRLEMNRVRGAPLTSVATHFLYPTIAGFTEAGGQAGPQGPQFDFDQYPEGSMAVAEKYIRLAGYPSGKYTGGEAVTIVGALGNPAEQDAEIVNQTLLSLGFVTHFKLVETPTMYAKYCNVPKQEVDVCPSVGWIADFAEPQAALELNFNGEYINPTGNVNWSQTNVPAINKAMKQANELLGEAAQTAAWAKIDEALVEDAAAVPFSWDTSSSIEGRDVNGLADLWNTGSWDYAWTSLK